MKSRRH